MTIKKCTCGKHLDTKTIIDTVKTVLDIGPKKYRALWFTCPACFSTAFIRKPVKTLPAKK